MSEYSEDTTIIKQPLKLITIPLNKFREEVIPYHQEIFDQRKVMVLKLQSVNNVILLDQELKSFRKEVKQLKDSMFELEGLRAQVENSDLERFDEKTLPLRNSIHSLVLNYEGLEKIVVSAIVRNRGTVYEDIKDNSNPLEGESQIYVYEDIQELKLKEREETLMTVEHIYRDVEDLHEAFTHLHGMVNSQCQDVDKTEAQTESANVNVKAGLKDIIKAHKLKTVTYPVTGALLGSIIGGPIGLIAGLKVGGLAALGCAVAGYTGGQYIKTTKTSVDKQEVTNEILTNEQSEDNIEKKDK